jgi:hypothetical protein
LEIPPAIAIFKAGLASPEAIGKALDDFAVVKKYLH